MVRRDAPESVGQIAGAIQVLLEGYARRASIDPAQVNAQRPFSGDVFDSLAFVGIISELETVFACRFTAEELIRIEQSDLAGVVGLVVAARNRAEDG